MDELGLNDYIAILRRRKKVFTVVAASVFVVSLLFAFNWSNYRSMATVEIAQAEIPENITTPAGMSAGAMLESLADLRISRLQQKVMSTGSLVEIITKFNLYPNERRYKPVAEIANKMQSQIKLNLISGSLANPASAQKASAGQLSAIAFKIGFDYEDPLLSQQVTNEIVTRFLDEDLKERKNQSKETSAFLDSQIKLLEASIAEQEKQIAEYKAAHGDIRPEALAFNQQALASTTISLQNLESQITTNLGSQGALRAQLATLDPYSRIVNDGQLMTTPTIQLRSLKSEQATLSAKYGPSHPDVIKINRQIASLEGQLGKGNSSAVLQSKIADVSTKLAMAEKSSGDNNPDVISLRNQLEKLERQLAEEQKHPQKIESVKSDADNPAYLQVVAQLRTAEEQYRALQSQKASLQAQIDKYQRAVTENPATEQQLASLSRDYENSRMRFRDLKSKKMAADMSEAVEQDRTGQHLVVINPPELPTSTHPTRIMFMVAGLFLSFACGLGCVIVLQLLSNSVASARHLESIVGAAPLVSIPHLTTMSETTKTDTNRLRAAGGTIAFAIIGLIAFSYVVMPLDVLLSIIARKLGLY